ncbi:MAG: response regulator transcription factor [Acidimicrobiia bacterium]|nr:response regulator transcription factor [Acidimicrobiia bacterium]MBT8246253.1 response regulator transcription factor [Acidimicrobiia bacterium]NNF89100.1 response regulator transcription factor [Acidimicrobiia bacterium]NNL14207.1 response regulator transcription factor [Acidimicrobiia bacterium]NNL98893.1 response regulator transcription factor [Acidimicrobiia bacterium]
MISVLVAEDHTLVRDMLENQLEHAGFDVVAVVDSSDAAVGAAGTHQPDVAVLDIDMPGISVFEAVRRMRRCSPATRALFLSAFVNDGYVHQALAVEASGYLTKTESVETVAEAIKTVHRGATHFSEAVLDRIVIGPGGAVLLSSGSSRIDTLTGREREVLGYVARGLAQKQIGRLMGISVKTVQHHITHLMDKLEIHDRVELARFSIREGVSQP